MIDPEARNVIDTSVALAVDVTGAPHLLFYDHVFGLRPGFR